MNLLQRIQDATIDPKFDLADILRMSKILAADLKHKAFKEWIEQELNGYEKSECIPDYRILQNLGCRGTFMGSFGRTLKNAPIPLIFLPEDVKEAVSTKYITDGVSALASTVSEAKQVNNSLLRMYWPADAFVLLDLSIYQGMGCVEAWIDIPTSTFVAILDTVKSRILDFAIEIEAETLDKGASHTSDKPISEQAINYIFERCILHQYHDQVDLSFIQTHNQFTDMSENYTNNFQNSNFANMANTVKDNARQQANQHIHLTEQKRTLAEAANEIQQLIQQLEQTNPTATEAEKVSHINDETTPSFKRRVSSALRASGETAIDEFILENKYLKVVKAAIKGWAKPN